MKKKNVVTDRSIERAALANVTYSDFLLNIRRYQFASKFYRSGDKVLDIACGTGYGISFFPKSKLFIAADIDLNALKTAKALYKKPNSHFLQCDAIHLPFDDNSFDFVTSFETIEHLDKPGLFLKEIRRVLKPDGMLIMSTPNRLYKFGWVRNINPYHVHEYESVEFSSLVNDFFGSVKAYCQKPPVYRRLLDNVVWSVAKAISLLPSLISSNVLSFARKFRLLVSRPSPGARIDMQKLPSNNGYEIQECDGKRSTNLKKPQTIILYAINADDNS